MSTSDHLHSRSYSNNWRTMVGVDSLTVDRKLRAAGLHLFFIVGELDFIELAGAQLQFAEALEVSDLMPVPVESGSKMMRLPVEVLQPHA
jgi:hypothetical protein